MSPQAKVVSVAFWGPYCLLLLHRHGWLLCLLKLLLETFCLLMYLGSCIFPAILSQYSLENVQEIDFWLAVQSSRLHSRYSRSQRRLWAVIIWIITPILRIDLNETTAISVARYHQLAAKKLLTCERTAEVSFWKPHWGERENARRLHICRLHAVWTNCGAN